MQSNKPNVLIMVADDHRASALGINGDKTVQTPHLDALSRAGANFSHLFTTVPICTPARAELLTGRCAYRNGVPFFEYAAPEHITWLPQCFANAGYATYFVGKWHNQASPMDMGFQRVRRQKLGGMWDHEVSFEEGEKCVQGFSSNLFADAVCEFLQEEQNAPWLAYVAFTAPHDPRTPPREFRDMYPPETVPLPPNYMPEHPFDNGEMTIRDEQLEAWPRTQGAIKRHLAEYYGMISHLDQQIGRIMEALEQSGQADNTIVVYVADHGLAVGSHGLMGKMNMYDHSVRVPFLLRGPGVPSGLSSSALCQSYDLLPTLCELAGIEIPATVEGHSLLPVLTGTAQSHRPAVFGGYQHPVADDPSSCGGPFLRHLQRMARDEHHKLIQYPNSGREQLFDVQADPHELHDLLCEWRLKSSTWFEPPPQDVDVQAVATGLRDQLLNWQHQVGDPLLQGNPSPLPKIVD